MLGLTREIEPVCFGEYSTAVGVCYDTAPQTSKEGRQELSKSTPVISTPSRFHRLPEQCSQLGTE